MMNDLSAWRKPEKLLRYFGVQEPRHIDLEAIAFHCSATVSYRELSGCAARILGHEGKAIIAVDAESKPERQRFSIAHELGHWIFDRGTIGFTCTAKQFAFDWQAVSPEVRANRFASELLLPEYLFRPDAERRATTMETVKELRDKYRTSLTATARRLVRLGSYPSIFVCTSAETGRRWFVAHPDVPSSLFPNQWPGHESAAYFILKGTRTAASGYIPADAWTGHPEAHRYVIREDSVPLGRRACLSLLWWEDQAQIIHAHGE